jgi:hypothetical protein
MYKVVTRPIASTLSYTAGVDITGARHVSITVPTFISGYNSDYCCVYVEVASALTGGTWRQLHDMGMWSGTSGIGRWEIPKGLGNYTVPCPAATHFDYMRVHLQSDVTATMNVYVNCKYGID